MRRFLSAFLCTLFILPQAVLADFRFSPNFNRAGLIKWRSWSEATLSEARKADKPILLSLSAVWCHWCHVMDETTYSYEDVIRFINENFIPVRVDADMRPDIDSLYNQGGWPSTLVLTAKGDILHGGTYLAPDEMVPWLVRSLALYKEYSVNAGIKGKVKKGRQVMPASSERPDISRTISFLKSEFDDKYGGFSGPQKFPNPDAINFLLSEFARTGDHELMAVIEKTLDEMAKGDIHDKTGGGFFRYATRRDWSVPHYEKMLELNAEIARNYAFAYQVFKRPHYRKITVETLDYILKTLFDRSKGMFYGSQDADENYYLSQKRAGMKPPNVDTVFYAGPNARMISALVSASGATGRVDYLKYAVRAADFMIKNLYSPKDGISRFLLGSQAGLKGLLDDNALFGLTLLDLYNVTGKDKYLEISLQTGRMIMEKFFESETGGFKPSLDTTLVQPGEPGMLLEYNSGVANFHAIELILRLYRTDGDLKIMQTGTAALNSVRKGCEGYGPGSGLCGCAMKWEIQDPFEIVVVTQGRPESFLFEANKTYIPEKVVKVFSIKKNRAEIAGLGYPSEPALYLCSGKKCLASVIRPVDVRDSIAQFMKGLSLR